MVQIGIDCDNTKCKTKVKNYKFKLFRQLRCRESVSGNFDQHEFCVKSVKETGCEGKMRDTKTFSFELPMYEPDISLEQKGGGTVGRSSTAI